MKALLRWIFCFALSLLLLTAGYKWLGGPAGDVKLASALVEPAMAQTLPAEVLLVNASCPLPSGFIADDLVNLYDHKRSFQLMTSDIRLTQQTFEAANQMFEAANQEGVGGFIVTSGYRTEEKQRELYLNCEEGTAAYPGASEHQTGLSFDVTAHYDQGTFEDTEQFRWLEENCWNYGFILRYPEGKTQITGISYEPWHYRYVGVAIAQDIYKNGWTLEEYCQAYNF